MNPMANFCHVCYDPNAAYHYGGIACSGCKGFFRRTVSYKRKYTCNYFGKCAIEKRFRNRCRACRFAKCLDAGFDPKFRGDHGLSFIKTEQESIPSLPIEHDSSTSPPLKQSLSSLAIAFKTHDKQKIMEENYQKWHHLSLNMRFPDNDLRNKPLSVMRIIPNFDRANDFSIAQFFVQVERLCDNYYDTTAQHMFSSADEYSCSTSLRAEQAFFQPRNMSSRTMIDWKPRYVINSLGVKPMWCRVVTHYADWVSHIPEFSKLCYKDQLKLIVDRSAPCVCVLIAYKTYITNAEGIVLSGGAYFPRDELQQEIMDQTIRPYLKRLTDILYDEFVIPATKMKMTEIEYALLRLLVFLMPANQMTSEGKEIVRQASNFYRNILCLQIRNQFSNWEIDQVLDRMAKILSFLPLMEIAKSAANAGFSVMTLFDIAQMKGELIYDVHVKRD